MGSKKPPKQEAAPAPVARDVTSNIAEELVSDMRKRRTGRKSSFLTMGQRSAQQPKTLGTQSLLGA